MTKERAWIIGRSGLLGSALSRTHPEASLFRSSPVPWTEPGGAVDVLSRDLQRFTSGSAADGRWSIYWAAGTGVIGSDACHFSRETTVLSGFLDALRAVPRSQAGGFFFASSASVYGGSTGAPFSETTAPLALNTYAATKLHQEQLIIDALRGIRPHVIGRISTLFGPGQNVTKGQGLISRMCVQAALRRPLSLYVPIDTLRDYVFVDDAARAITLFLAAAQTSGDAGTRIRVVARGVPMTVAQVATSVRVIAHRRVGISQAAPASSSAHVPDLRVRTEYAHELRDLTWTPMPAAIRAVYDEVLRGLQRGQVHLS